MTFSLAPYFRFWRQPTAASLSFCAKHWAEVHFAWPTWNNHKALNLIQISIPMWCFRCSTRRSLSVTFILWYVNGDVTNLHVWCTKATTSARFARCTRLLRAFSFWYISLLSSVKQPREITQAEVLRRACKFLLCFIRGLFFWQLMLILYSERTTEARIPV